MLLEKISFIVQFEYTAYKWSTANFSRGVVCYTILDFIFKALAVGIMWLYKFSTLFCINNCISYDYSWKFDNTTSTEWIIKGGEEGDLFIF